MNKLNLIVLEGNACRDAEKRSTGTGTELCKFSIAYNRYYKSGDNFYKDVSFFDVDCFGDVAKLCIDNVKKGDAVRITGRLKQSRWEQDGKSRSTVVVIAERVEIGMKAKNDDSASFIKDGPDYDTATF
jgi:single-strand DNA-binding protein